MPAKRPKSAYLLYSTSTAILLSYDMHAAYAICMTGNSTVPTSYVAADWCSPWPHTCSTTSNTAFTDHALLPSQIFSKLKTLQMSDTQEGPLDWGVGTDKKEANFEYLSFSAHHEDVYPAGHQATNTTDGQELSPVAEVHSTSTPELILPVDGLGTGPTLPMLLRDHLLGTDTPGMRGRFSMPGSQRMSLIGEEVLQPLHCRVLPPAKVSGPSGIPGAPS